MKANMAIDAHVLINEKPMPKIYVHIPIIIILLEFLMTGGGMSSSANR
jgi:hypothetical protein